MTSLVCLDDARGKHLLAALSGGADSVALLCLLAEQRDALGLRLSAAHLNHGIRTEAEGDAQFCRELCRALDVELIEEKADVPAIAKARQLGLETAARDARYGFLHRAKERCGADWIALAHHMDDQAETILMHLLRGAGPEGISGMQRLNGCLYRPLLGLRKAQLQEYLERRGTPWREDATNAVSDNPRNALRLNALPEIEKCYPRAAEAIARYGRIAGIESAYLARVSGAFLREHAKRMPGGWRIEVNDGCEEAILRRAIRHICGESLGSRKLDEIIAICEKQRGSCDVLGDVFAERTPDALYLLHRGRKIPGAVPLKLPGETILPGICRVLAEAGDFQIEWENKEIEILDAEKLEGAVLRTRRQGDRIRPLGSAGSRLLSDYLTDKKIDRPMRDIMPLLAVENRVLWTGGAGIAEDARIDENTKRRVRLSFNYITDEQAEVQS